MGVKNLWRLLLPTGHRLSIETLSHQTLAIDASIWLAQISNACRDPETGRLLPNKPHVRIFLLRLMRLLYHQIKPVVVFDGVMPEVKRREIQRRKDRREKLWRDDDDDGGDGGGGGALKRTAKKILVKQLKDMKEKEAASRVKKKGGINNNNNNNNNYGEKGEKKKEVGQSSNRGAVAPGFMLEDDEDDEAYGAAQMSSDRNKKDEHAEKNKSVSGNEEDVISINSQDTEKDNPTQQQKIQSQLDHYRHKHEKDEDGDDQDESENDWEMSHAIQSSIDDSFQQNQKQSSQKSSTTTTTNHSYKSSELFVHEHFQSATNKTIASLPSETRSKWIESQWSSRRIASRRECIEAAANPEEYSSTQLRNFLKLTKLNKRVGEIDKLVESGVVDVWEEEEEKEAVSCVQSVRPVLHRLKRCNGDHSDSDVEDSALFTSANVANNGGASTKVGRASMEVLFGEDDSDVDEEEEGGGGFLVASAAAESTSANDADEDSGEGGGGGFLVTSDDNKPTANAVDSTSETGIEKKEVVFLDDDAVRSDDNNALLSTLNPSSNGNSSMRSLFAPSESTNHATTDIFRPSTLLDFSTAEQEWEEWEGAAADDNETNSSEGLRSNNVTRAQADNETAAGAVELDTSESDDDDDDERMDSFLMLDSCRPLSNRVVKPKRDSDVANVTAGKTTCAASLSAADTALENNAVDTDDEDDDDDVDWEDGDSGDDHNNEDELDHGTSIGGQELSLDHHKDINCNEDHRSVKWNESAFPTQTEAREPNRFDRENTNSNSDTSVVKRNENACSAEVLKSDPSVSIRNGGTGLYQTDQIGCPEQLTNEKNYGSDNKNNGVIEIPSGDDISVKTNDGVTKGIIPSEPNPSSNNNREESLDIGIYDDSPIENNEFGEFRSNDLNAAALQHAQETASRLTSWAGRAFQRAISAHVGQQMQNASPSNTVDTVLGQNNLTPSNDVIEIDAIANNLAEDSTEVKGHGQSNTMDMDSNGNYLSPEQKQQNSLREEDLFDTSAEGLNEAHNAIIEEERAMERGDMSTITDEMKEDILSLLRLCGIPWVESPSEAEAQCAALEELGLVDGVVTEDSDIFVFGGRKVYKNFFDEKKYVEAYFAKDIERDLALKKHQLVALAMLLGGDYTDGVKGVGIVNGMEALQAFPINDSAHGISDGLTKFREWLDGFGDPVSDGNHKRYLSKEALFHKKHKTGRTRWVAPADFPSQAIINAYLKPVVDKSKAKFSWGKPNLQGLQHFCADTLGWEQDETDRVVNPVLKVIQSGSKQTRIESYFMRYEDGITFAKVKSKRLQAVLHDIQDNVNADDMDHVAADNIDLDMADADDEGSKRKGKRQRKK